MRCRGRVKILNRYIAGQYLTYFLVCFISLLAIGLTFSALAELDLLAEEGGIWLFIDSILTNLPLLAEIILPMSVLLGTILTFSAFSKNSEAVAMQAVGISPLQMLKPVLLLGIFIAAGAYANQSYLAPLWGADEKLMLVKPQPPTFAWRFFQGRLFYFGNLKDFKFQAGKGQIYAFTPEHRIARLQETKRLRQEGETIEFKVQRIVNFSNQGIQVAPGEAETWQQQTFPVIFKPHINHPRYSGFSDIAREVQLKRLGGENYQAELFAAYQKTAGVIAVFVMILLALPFSLFSHRAANVRTGIVIAVILGLLFWLFEQVFAGLFEAGFLPGLVAAFLADVLFLLLGGYLLKVRLG